MAPGTATLTEAVPGTIALAGNSAGADFWDRFESVDELQLPDPITFVIGSRWLDRPNLYPRQATLLKIIFLRDDLFTDYDHQVIAEWIAEFHATNPNAGPENKFEAKTNGIQPDIYERIAWLKERGYRWFKEVLFAVGRRGSKGYVCSLAMSYVLWAYLCRGDPQDFYGIDRDKQLAVMIFAGKKEQAKQNLWGDLYNAITGSYCFAPYISEAQAESVTIFAPHDEVRMRKLAERGIRTTKDMASFGVYPKESTLLSGRGPAACMDPGTLVLKSDLTWVPIRDIHVGDHVIALDEFPDVRYRKLRESVVEAKRTTRKPALRLEFDDGTSVTCSADHRWLWREKGRGGTMHWKEAGRLKVGHEIKFLADPWEYDGSREAGYLAGVFDGEGCIPDHSRSNPGNRGIHVSQNPGVVLDEIHRCLKACGFNPVPHGSGAYRKSEEYLCQQWSLRGVAECMRFLGSVRPPRLMEISKRTWEGAALRGGYSQAGRFLGRNKKKIVKITQLPEQELIDIQTSSRTFIANGFISHNCILGFDEAAHVKNAGTSRQFGDVYGAAGPALDQFGKDAFIVIPSSTWEMTGKFYELWQNSLERETDEAGEFTGIYPNKLMVQLASWDPYKDWEAAPDLELFPAGFTGDLGEYHDTELPHLQEMKGAIQIYDDDMAREERANPDTFGVERRCLDPATRVLTADLTWKQIGDVEPGEQLIGLDEFAPKGKQRKLRTSTVVHTWRSHDRAYRLTFGDGSSVVCSGTHRWFSDNRWRSLYPAPGVPGPRTVLKVGDSIRWIVDPWDDDDSWEAGWLAGIYDGEGSFLGRGRDQQEFSISVSQNPGLVLEKILSTLKDKGFAPVKEGWSRKCEKWYVTNLDECLRLVGQIKPARFYARRQQLWEGRAPHGSRVRSKTKTIISIEELPEQELVDIQTTTGTFIAEGLVSHNSWWATSLDAYLNPGKVDAMFLPWADRPEAYGPTRLEMQTRGPLTMFYRAHGDPANVNCRFGFAMAHTERGPDKMLHAVFDLIKFWDPADYDDHFVDYDEITTWIFDYVITKFHPEELTFDQFNVPSTVQVLQKQVREAHLPKRVQIYERDATGPLNWATYETFKGALNMGFVHAPVHAEASDELKFVRKPEGQAKVVPPDSGPVVTKDIADCIAIVTAALLGEQMAFLGAALGGQRPGAGMHTSQTDPLNRFDPATTMTNPFASALGGASLARGQRPGMTRVNFPGSRRQSGLTPGFSGMRRRRS